MIKTTIRYFPVHMWSLFAHHVWSIKTLIVILIWKKYLNKHRSVVSCIRSLGPVSLMSGLVSKSDHVMNFPSLVCTSPHCLPPLADVWSPAPRVRLCEGASAGLHPPPFPSAGRAPEHTRRRRAVAHLTRSHPGNIFLHWYERSVMVICLTFQPQNIRPFFIQSAASTKSICAVKDFMWFNLNHDRRFYYFHSETATFKLKFQTRRIIQGGEIKKSWFTFFIQLGMLQCSEINQSHLSSFWNTNIQYCALKLQFSGHFHEIYYLLTWE